MKFRNGAWLWESGVTPACMKRAHSYRIDDRVLTLWALDRSGTEGSDRFEGVVLEMRVTSPMADVIRVQVRHHRPSRTGVTGLDLNYAPKADAVRMEDPPAGESVRK
jgi:hypothetical protein